MAPNVIQNLQNTSIRGFVSREATAEYLAQVRDSSDTGSEDGSFSAVSMQSSHYRSPSRDDSMDLGVRHAPFAARRIRKSKKSVLQIACVLDAASLMRRSGWRR